MDRIHVCVMVCAGFLSGCSAAVGSSSNDSPDGAAQQQPPKPTVAACNALPASGTWEDITPTGVVTSDALSMDPFDIGTIWLGADPKGGGPGLGGLFKSTDCGASWTHVNTGTNGATLDGAIIWSMVVDPIAQGTIYVVGAYGPQGVWKSVNGGVDWVQLFPPDSEFAKVVEYNFVSNISMDPRNHLHLVVGTHGDCAAPYAPVCQAESMDGGATWKIVKIPNPTGMWTERTGPYLIDDSVWLFATEFNGMFLTLDHGANWSNVTPQGVLGATGGEVTHRPFAPSAAGVYYLPSFGPGGLLKSLDGKAWSIVAGAPAGIEQAFTMGGANLWLADFNTGLYYVAAESDPSKWTAFPGPFTVTATKQGPIILEYDEPHHLLYSSNFTGGLWRVVTQ